MFGPCQVDDVASSEFRSRSMLRILAFWVLVASAPAQSGQVALKGATVVRSGPGHVSDDIRGVDALKSRLHMDIRQ